MSDEANNPGAATDQSQRRVQIMKLYLKDASFESPAVPALFSADHQPQQPSVDLQLNTELQRVGENLHEVVLVVTVTGKDEERTLFLVEVKQAALFHIEGFAGDELEHLLNAYCPGTLFPYAREAVSDLVNKGALPQVTLQPVNFDALYLQHRRKQQAGDSAAAT